MKARFVEGIRGQESNFVPLVATIQNPDSKKRAARRKPNATYFNDFEEISDQND
jgi:hypothetical protein